MTLRVHHNHDKSRSFVMGRRKPVSLGPHMRFRNYLRRHMPLAPEECDYTPAAMPALDKIYLNDQLGCCVISGMAHIIGLVTANAGLPPFLFTDQQIVDEYGVVGGYDPSNPSSDQGCDEQTALNSWFKSGFPPGSHQIAGWMTVNAADPQEYRLAMWLFENLFFGVGLPDAWISPVPSASGFVWDVNGPSDPQNGHCFIGCGHSQKGITLSTWGMTGLLTDAAVANYASHNSGGGLYVIVTKDSLNKASQKAASGFDWSQLCADFDSLGGHV